MRACACARARACAQVSKHVCVRVHRSRSLICALACVLAKWDKGGSHAPWEGDAREATRGLPDSIRLKHVDSRDVLDQPWGAKEMRSVSFFFAGRLSPSFLRFFTNPLALLPRQKKRSGCIPNSPFRSYPFYPTPFPPLPLHLHPLPEERHHAVRRALWRGVAEGAAHSVVPAAVGSLVN